MLSFLLQLQAGRHDPATVRRAVDEVFRARGYRRRGGQSLLDTILETLTRWLREASSWIERHLDGHPMARRVIIVVVAVIVIALVARGLYLASLDRDARRRGWRERGEAGTRDYLAAAQAMAAEGRYLEAAHLLYQAVVRDLARRRVVRFHPSRTSGDYLADLRSHSSPLLAGFRTFVRTYERIAFRAQHCSAEDYQVLLRLSTLDQAKAA